MTPASVVRIRVCARMCSLPGSRLSREADLIRPQTGAGEQERILRWPALGDSETPACGAILTSMKHWIGLVLCLMSAAAAAQPRRPATSSAAPRNDLPQPYRTARDWGQLPPGVKWAAVTAVEPAPNGTIYVVHRCADNSCAGRPEAPILVYDKCGRLLQDVWRRVVPLPAWRGRRSRQQPVGHRCARRRQDGAAGLQVQSRRHGADDARQEGRVGLGCRRLRSADRRAGGAERRDLRRRQSSQRQEQPHREVHEGREVHQGVGNERDGSRPDQRTAHHRHGFARAALRRRSREQPHPDLRSGRRVPRGVAPVRPSEWNRDHRRTTRFTCATPNRVPIRVRTS